MPGAGPVFTLLQLAVMAMAAIAFLTFALSASLVFPAISAQPLSDSGRRPGSAPRSIRRSSWRQWATALAVVTLAGVHLALVARDIAADAIALALALALYAVGVLLFVLAGRAIGRQQARGGTASQSDWLVSNGPFALVRHPCYAAHLCCWIAGTLVTFSPWLLLLTVWLAALHGVAAYYEEQAIAGTASRDRYASYRRQTGMFVPRVLIEFDTPRPMTWSETDVAAPHRFVDRSGRGPLQQPHEMRSTAL